MAVDEARRRELEKMLKERRRVLQESASATIAERMAGDERVELDREGHFDIDLEVAIARIDTIKKINDALHRLESGTYGRCGDCEEEIAEKRLKALPFARRCRFCEEQREGAELVDASRAARSYPQRIFAGRTSSLSS